MRQTELLLDAGANIDVKAEHLAQFAIIGAPLSPVATAQEFRALEEDYDRKEWIRKYWKQKDPTPTTTCKHRSPDLMMNSIAPHLVPA